MSIPGSPSKDTNIKGKLSDIYNSLDKNDNRANDFESRIKQLESDRDSAGDDMAENLKTLNTKIDSEVHHCCDASIIMHYSSFRTYSDCALGSHFRAPQKQFKLLVSPQVPVHAHYFITAFNTNITLLIHR